MTALTRPFRRLAGRADPGRGRRPRSGVPAVPAEQPGVAVDIPETDPLFAYLQSAPGPVDLTRLELASPALDELRAAGVALVVPLVTQGELIGTLNLGPRLSEQEYSTDDRRLLATLAAQAAPAIRVAQLVREQAAEAAERERYEQELKVAQLIQQQFLPRELPNLPEWQIAAYYGPARVVGGDFYDFIDLGEGRIGVVVGDVTDKGVPAALVMARTHSILRAEAPRLDRARPGPRPRERAAGARDAGPDVRHLPVRRPGARDRPLRVRERRPQPALRAHRRRRHRAAGDRAAARPDARASPTRRPRASSARATRCCCTPTGWSSSTAPAARCTASRGCARRWTATTPAAQLLDRLLDELHAFTGPGLRAGGRHHARHAAARRPAWPPRLERGPARVELTRDDGRRGAAEPSPCSASRSRAPSATSGPRCSAWPRPSRRWAWSPRASSASRPRSPRP